MQLKARIAVPDSAAAGQVIEIKTLVSHPMDSGFRSDARGRIVPRNILTRFECEYAGQTVFAMDLQPAIAANPYIAFFLRAVVSGDITFRWTDQNGQTYEETKALVVG